MGGPLFLRAEIDTTDPTAPKIFFLPANCLATFGGAPLRTANGGFLRKAGLTFFRAEIDSTDPTAPRLGNVSVLKTTQGIALRTALGGFLLSTKPLPASIYTLSGVTFDSNGAILPSCAVGLYRTSDDKLMDRTVSDAVTGAFSFQTIGPGELYYMVGYLVGAPDVEGTTLNTLQGVGV